jgi:hypothetical protein
MTTTRCALPPPALAHDLEMRLARAAGQLAGVQRMLTEDRPPLEVIDQLHAVAAAVDAVAVRAGRAVARGLRRGRTVRRRGRAGRGGAASRRAASLTRQAVTQPDPQVGPPTPGAASRPPGLVPALGALALTGLTGTALRRQAVVARRRYGQVPPEP